MNFRPSPGCRSGVAGGKRCTSEEDEEELGSVVASDFERIIGIVKSICLTILIVSSALAACADRSPAGPVSPVAFFGPCFQQPNFIFDVQLNRWRSFPLAYFFDSSSFEPDLIDDYRDAVTSGLHRWAEATGTGLGAVVEVDDRLQAQFVITSRDLSPPEQFARTFHSTGTPFLAGGEIAFKRSDLTEIEDRIRDGEIDADVFFGVVAGVTAHEMGHLLGIIGHSPRDDVLMGTEYHDFPTIADVNTLIHAYCRDS